MEISDILMLYEYNYWANARVLAAADHVNTEQLTAPADVSHGSLHSTLVHILSAEWMWRMRCRGVFPSAMLPEDEFPTLDAVRARWQAEEEAMRSFLQGLSSDEELGQTVEYTRTSGTPGESKLWHILTHVVNHGTQHRGEAGILLTRYGSSPGDLDFITFLREQG